MRRKHLIANTGGAKVPTCPPFIHAMKANQVSLSLLLDRFNTLTSSAMKVHIIAIAFFAITIMKSTNLSGSWDNKT